MMTNLFSNILADRAAYESGQKVGQIMVYVVIGVIVIWLLKKVFAR